MADILHRFEIQVGPEAIYRALVDPEQLSKWWTDSVKGESSPGHTLAFGFYDGAVVITMEVTAVEKMESVHWNCVSGPEDWVGTQLAFNLVASGNKTVVLFGHKNWKEISEHFMHSNSQWAVFLLSLKSYLETGKGSPAPHCTWV